MTKKKSNLLSNFSIYFIASIVEAIISFFFTPLLTKYLGLDEYGKYELFNSITNIVLNISIFGSTTYYVKNYYKKNENDNLYIKANIIVFNFLSSLVFVALYSIINSIFKNNLHFDFSLIVILFLTVFLGIVKTVYLLDLQLRNKSITYSLVAILEVIIECLITLIIIKCFFISFYVRILGVLISLGLLALIVLFREHFIKNLREYFSWNTIKELFIFGIPFVFSTVSSWAMEMIDKFFISGMIGLGQNAIYSIGYKFGMVIMMIEVAFSKAWAPYFYKNLGSDSKNVIRNIVVLTSFFLLGICIYIPIAKYFLVIMFGERYLYAREIIPIICFAYFFDHLWKILNNYFIYLNKTWFYNISLIISGVLNVIMDCFLIKDFGIKGAAVATLISFAFGFCLSLLYFIICIRKRNCYETSK